MKLVTFNLRCESKCDGNNAFHHRRGFVIDRLDYLYKGGRCSALSAFGGNLLKLKPCIEVKDGKMTPGKKYRGPIDKVMLQYADDRLRGRDDINKHRVFITHTRCAPEAVEAGRRASLRH